MRLFPAIGAEFAKIFTTRMWWVLALILVVYIGLLAGGLAAFFGWTIANPEVSGAGGATAIPPESDLAGLMYSFATSVGYVFPVLLGALAVTSEFRHQTLTPTFLANPHRAVVLWAKFSALFVVGGVVFGVLGWVSSVGPAAGALALWDLDPVLDDPDTWAMVGRGILAMALWAAVGVGLGALVPNQVAAIVIVIAFTQFVEPVLRLVATLNDVTAEIGKYLPGAASDALVGASFYQIAAMGSGEILEWWQGGLVLAAIAVVTTLIGYFTSWRRDVT
ncbi:ABC transporter permease [Agromyces rhizosphaerae]|uniref:ABC transporter permease n=1 Tax=Agromyces rhizosphaerae TaxID=88374 RepID=A0A9W6D080_9MICO|nr:ABC transporter permease [Agromyces rhizosphaerae]GLI27083.1 ABC transporter permease [Agromyces rhizosphaerae]